MKRRITSLLLFTFSLAGCVVAADPLAPIVHADSLGTPRHTVFQAPNCTIKDVQFSDQSIFVQFTGHWSPSFGFPDTGNNGFSISRDHSISQHTWAFVARRFSDRQGKPVTITITTNKGWVVHGGILLVRFPTDSFEVTSATTQ